MNYDESLDARASDFLQEMEVLMQQGKRVVAVEWREALDGPESRALAKRYNYICQEDTNPNNPFRAYFYPSSSVKPLIPPVGSN